MPTFRKRKHAVTEDQSANKILSTGGAQKSIRSFGNVSKPRETIETSKRLKTVHEREPTPPAIILTKPTSAKASTKRKRSLESVAEGSHEKERPAPQHGNLKQFAKPENKSTPRNKRFKTALPPSPAETPSKNAAALFDKLKLDAGVNAIPCALGKRSAGYETPPDTPKLSHDTGAICFPAELQDLCQLHAAFLSALSLYYAHNGTSSPVNVKSVLPMVTKIWRKRAVTLQDLRRLLAVNAGTQDSFVLEDFGRAGLCLSKSQARGRALKRAASFVDEDYLNARFEMELFRKWEGWQHVAHTADGATFVSELPLAEIEKHASNFAAAPLFARGQQRLADLKSAQASSLSTSSGRPTPILPHVATTSAIQNRSTSLLDRVLAKQAHAASMPAGPTKLQLERKTALHKIEEIARVLDLLATKPRVSLSMRATVQQLQQSVRNPISREEVERCLQLMATEVTPGFVRVVESGGVQGVVVSRSGRMSGEEVREGVERASASA